MADTQLQMQDAVKATLLRTDESFRQLVTQHQALDERLRHLATYPRLTEQQQYEETSIK